MYEVFDYITGQTVGYTETEAEALEAIRRDARLDYLCADCNTYECEHLMAPVASLIAALEDEPYCAESHYGPWGMQGVQDSF